MAHTGFRVRPGAPERHRELDLTRPPDAAPAPALAPDRQRLVLANPGDRQLVVRVERSAPRDDALTAARASTLALFRELFPAEVLAPGRLVSVATVTLLVAELERADELYEELGDAAAFGVIQGQLRCLDDSIRRGGGAVVRTAGEAMMAAFAEPADAVAAGLELGAVVGRDRPANSLRLRVGIHHGPAVVATVDDRLGYFGATVRRAESLPGRGQGGDLTLTRDVAADPRVAALLVGRGLEADILAAGATAPPGELLFRLRILPPSPHAVKSAR